MRDLDAHFGGDPGTDAADAGEDAAARGERLLYAADLTVTAFLCALCLSIVVNALALQARPGDRSPLPPHRPVVTSDAADKGAQSNVPDVPKPAARAAAASSGNATGGMTNGTLGYLVARTLAVDTPVSSPSAPAAGVDDGPDVTGAVRPPADVPGTSRVLAVQRALSRLGYGPLKVDGQAGTQTRLAIQRFQHDRNLPADGQITDRLVRELGAVSGQALN